MTMNDLTDGHLPAEWEYKCAVLIAWPHAGTDWSYVLDRAQKCVSDMVRAISSYAHVIIVAPEGEPIEDKLRGVPRDAYTVFRCEINDTWTRDYGPLTLADNHGEFRASDFKFNGWGLKFAADKDNMVTRHMHDAGLIKGRLADYEDFVLEGGGVESDGRGTVMTTAKCQLSPNRNPSFSREEIEGKLMERLGAKRIMWVNHGYLAGDDTDSHIDTLARFAPGDTIVYVGCDDPDDEHFVELQAMEKELASAKTIDGRPYNLVRLPMPEPMYDDDGNRLPATYANFLALKDAVIMPVYGQERTDELARRILEVVFDVPVVTVDCSVLVLQHGSLHCMTMQIPEKIIKR